MNFTNFDTFIFRCPVFPLNSILGFPKKESILKESIFLASPDLFQEVYINNETLSKKRHEKSYLSLLKYQTRMQFRCTPFGLFAGCGTGKVGKESKIVLNTPGCFQSITRLDMDFLCSLSSFISQIPEAIEKATYFPNSSLYPLFKSYRYVEYNYENKKRKHNLCEIEHTSYLESVIAISRNGATKAKIITTLSIELKEEYDIAEYVDSLIENQVIVSDFSPSLTCTDLLKEIVEKLESLSILPDLKNILLQIKGALTDLDKQPIGRDPAFYESIQKKIDLLKVNYEKKFLFQSDLKVIPQKAEISQKIIEAAKKGIAFLHKIASPDENLHLLKFKDEFYKRYEEEEIPLSEALDPDIGIGFSNALPGSVDFHPLLKNISKDKEPENINKTFSPFELLLLKKYNICVERNEQIMNLEDKDLDNLNKNEAKLPFTFSAIIEIIKTESNNNDPVLFIKNAGGSSAANLINRFAHTNTVINEYAGEIIKKENEFGGVENIIAEIVHLPEARTGNILSRPAHRKYEIPYLCKESTGIDFKIPVTDLLVSVKEGKICLRSKKLNKEIIPRLTTTHNFIFDSLPIYHFLCAFQSNNNIQNNLTFNWGHLQQNSFLPRVVYKNIILHAATWKVKKEIIAVINQSTNPIKELHTFKIEFGLPDSVLLVENDNKLLIDFNNTCLIQILLKTTKDILLEEFLFDTEHPLITAGEYIYRNEIILGFHKV